MAESCPSIHTISSDSNDRFREKQPVDVAAETSPVLLLRIERKLHIARKSGLPQARPYNLIKGEQLQKQIADRHIPVHTFTGIPL